MRASLLRQELLWQTIVHTFKPLKLNAKQNMLLFLEGHCAIMLCTFAGFKDIFQVVNILTESGCLPKYLDVI